MDITPINRVLQRVQRYSGIAQNIPAVIAKYVQATLEQYVQETYPDAIVNIIPVSNSNGVLTSILDIRDKELWFKEFGTGYVGAMSNIPWDYYPTVPLTFFSRGEMRHTQGWEYAYHPNTKRYGYWTYMGIRHYGQPAKAGATRAIIRIKYSGIPRLGELIRQEFMR